jgi:C6 transcription factor Pro1
LEQNLLLSELVLWYFDHVRKTQYIFAGNVVTNLAHSVRSSKQSDRSSTDSVTQLIVNERHGAVTSSLCALATLHLGRERLAQGLQSPDISAAQRSNAKMFYEDALFQLAQKKQMQGQYDETDAFASLQLVSYSLFSGGAVEWQPILAIAHEWLSQTGILEDEDPRFALTKMSVVGQFVVKMTVVSRLIEVSVHNSPAILRKVDGYFRKPHPLTTSQTLSLLPAPPAEW